MFGCHTTGPQTECRRPLPAAGVFWSPTRWPLVVGACRLRLATRPVSRRGSAPMGSRVIPTESTSGRCREIDEPPTVWWGVSLLAEDAGFEPARAVNPTRFPSERHRPLGESSAGEVTGAARVSATPVAGWARDSSGLDKLDHPVAGVGAGVAVMVVVSTGSTIRATELGGIRAALDWGPTPRAAITRPTPPGPEGSKGQ